jgi:hypothetical protein
MALVVEIEHVERNIRGPHKPVACSWDQFRGPDGRTYLQIVTYGSEDRQMCGEVSQTIQFDESAARHLLDLIGRVFGPRATQRI